MLLWKNHAKAAFDAQKLKFAYTKHSIALLLNTYTLRLTLTLEQALVSIRDKRNQIVRSLAELNSKEQTTT